MAERSEKLFLALLASTTASCAAGLEAAPRESFQSMPKYHSVADPSGVLPTRILVQDGGSLGFGSANEQFKSLLASDIGFSLYFVRVAGGIRTRNNPIVFPDAGQSDFEFDDFSCVSSPKDARSIEVTCKSKADGRNYRSRIESGGLVEFEIRCVDTTGQICRYQLVGGKPIRPNKIQPME